MYLLEIEDACEEAMRKKCRKNRALRDEIDARILWILENPHASKPLRAPLEGRRRVHVMKSFILVYGIDEARKIVKLLKFSHHDEAY